MIILVQIMNYPVPNSLVNIGLFIVLFIGCLEALSCSCIKASAVLSGVLKRLPPRKHKTQGQISLKSTPELHLTALRIFH